jgi:GTP-binding protein
MRRDQYPRDGRPEIAFAGRSNVGKSSLMNALLKRKGLAKTSGTPGKTQTLNFFDINRRFYFVDLPGYGYAKVPKTVKAIWNAAMAEYLRERAPLRLVVQLLDSRHKVSDKDLDMIGLLAELELPTLLVATKIDKLKRGERAACLAHIREVLGLDEEALVIPTSSETGEGLPHVWNAIEDCL